MAKRDPQRRGPQPYVVVGIRADGSQCEHTKIGSPTEAWMTAWGKDNGVIAVVRFYPRYAAWRIIDIRRCIKAQPTAGGRRWWTAPVRCQKHFPTEAAAVMYATMKLAGHSSTT